ncbi:MAG TPA: glycosyltransferase family 39 protein, partial [Nitrospiraceae bacterium]|nr:glycosyltransferase family 39 protein [Nitrospiraceae bacterium]
MPAGRVLILTAVIAIFFASLIGSLPLLSRYHFDEGWYTNAAIEMVRAGDYVTPRYPDGSVRFRKPILTYWVLITSYAAFGVGLVASRLPFLLAGAAVLWVTYRLARAMTGDTSTAVLAAAVLGSNIQFMESSTKATPDMLQCLFITMSLWGAAELVFRRRREARWYALLYVGAGLAIATKGMLAVVMILFIWAFARFGPLADREGIVLMHRGWLAVGLMIPLSWFVTSTLLQGSIAMSTLFEDQVGGRLEGAPSLVLPNLISYLFTPFRFFAPWLILVGIALLAERDLLAGYMERRKLLFWFVIGWLLVNIAVFSLGNLMRSRYLLPTYPLTAVLLADVLGQCAGRNSTAAYSIGRVVSWVMIGGVAAGIIVAVAGMRIDTGMMLGGLIFTTLTAALYVLASRRRLVPALVALSMAIMAAFGTLEQAVKPVFLTSPAEGITQRLLKLDPFPTRIAAVDVRQSLSNLIRLLSGGRLIVQEFRHNVSPETLQQFSVILASERTKEAFAAREDYVIEECGAAYDPPKLAAIWEWIKTGERPEAA